MISEIERGFNYTLTRDKLAMNLGSPPRKTKNVATPAPAPTSSATSSTTTSNTYPPAPSTPPQAPSSYPPRHDSRPSSDIRVASLEQQVAHLTQKGVEAADQLANYEEEIRNLKTQANPRVDSPLGIVAPTQQPAQSLSRNSSITSGKFSFLTRTSSLTTASKPLPKTSATSKSSPMAPSPSSAALTDLQQALAKETKARMAAEKKYHELEQELEDLSATLFEQANEMVAKERKEKARLEERIKVLEERDMLSRKRLEMVEGALGRIERVRKLLGSEG
ncbi:hypothetical protein D6C93_03591 [Aureobasidium pullulans]|uniref:GDP/GTP exchange factor Sec2 N-terminal domain-containing protein n=1 Tax=Aureobasidium pullulans TaxID=5580 RepID=A0A4S8W5L5_AURPU|nr:hypothetical protein D6D24_02221 [Aureobasidium pullulans]THW55050.1 hypothetical protein D6D20_09774 [Aureobasidium pullulans]THZ00839.1 hypothetical protein D6C93_03591 [Aureobasidium pullulans]THZ95692.1 hypothetical protein D6C82_07537 [Aureobasidium pullulans]